MREPAAARGAQAFIIGLALIAAVVATTSWIRWGAPRHDEAAASSITPVAGDTTPLTAREAARYAPDPCNKELAPVGPDTAAATRAWDLPGGTTIAVTAYVLPTGRDAYLQAQAVARAVVDCTAYTAADGTQYAIRDVSGAGIGYVPWSSSRGHDHDGLHLLSWTTVDTEQTGTVWASAVQHDTVYVASVTGTGHVPEPGTARSILLSQLSPATDAP